MWSLYFARAAGAARALPHGPAGESGGTHGLAPALDASGADPARAAGAIPADGS